MHQANKKVSKIRRASSKTQASYTVLKNFFSGVSQPTPSEFGVAKIWGFWETEIIKALKFENGISQTFGLDVDTSQRDSVVLVQNINHKWGTKKFVEIESQYLFAILEASKNFISSSESDWKTENLFRNRSSTPKIWTSKESEKPNLKTARKSESYFQGPFPYLGTVHVTSQHVPKLFR